MMVGKAEPFRTEGGKAALHAGKAALRGHVLRRKDETVNVRAQMDCNGVAKDFLYAVLTYFYD